AGPRGSGGWSWPVISAARAASASTTIVRTRPWRTRRCCAGARRTDPRLRPGSGVDLRGRVLARPPCRGRQSRRGRSNTYGLGAKCEETPEVLTTRRGAERTRFAAPALPAAARQAGGYAALTACAPTPDQGLGRAHHAPP